ncbi:MAG: hypothetical protein HW373_201, partial [Deltaproteobacteria bacterium]|nr:hypothetical protein [Deltaproteobacteria bacterium]
REPEQAPAQVERLLRIELVSRRALREIEQAA